MRIGDRLFRAVLAVTAVLGVLTMLAVVASLAFDLRPVVIRSGSMEPVISTGSLLVTHSVPADEVRVGDVVTVKTAAGGRVTHRVISLRDAGPGRAELRLQGDANPIPDESPVTVTSVDASWFAMPVLGTVIAWFSGSPGILVAAALVAVLVSVAMRKDDTPLRTRSRGAGSGPSGDGAPPRDRRWRPAGLRCSRRRSLLRLSILAFALGIAPAAAAWSDAATASGSTLSSTSIKPEQTPTSPCTTGALRSVTTSWQVSAALGVAYRATLRETGANLTVTRNGTVASTTLFADQAPFSTGESFVRIDVQATLGQWTATSTRQVRIGPLRLSATCQDWT